MSMMLVHELSVLVYGPGNWAGPEAWALAHEPYAPSASVSKPSEVDLIQGVTPVLVSQQKVNIPSRSLLVQVILLLLCLERSV